MKKILYLITIFAVSFVMIGSVLANPKISGLQEAVAEEIDYFGNAENFTSNGVLNESAFNAYQEYVNKLKSADLSNYNLSDDKVNVYMFRGRTCWHCLDEITFFATKVAEYGKYFNFITYEVWENSDNSKLMNTVAKFLGENSDGVPYTIIGKKTYSGFSEATGEQMLNEIQNLYNQSDRYDIKNDINLETGAVINNKDNSKTIITMIVLAVVLIGGIIVIYFVSKSK